jgi:hypothetical protein
MRLSTTIAAVALWALIEQASAVEIEPMGKAVGTLLGTTKGVKQKKTKLDGRDIWVFYAGGKAAFIDKAVYPPDCTHTWAIGVDGEGKITEIRVIEMKCPHAFPCKTASFLDQYKGKGPADADKLEDDVDTVAKATYTANYTTDVARRSIKAFQALKGQLK